jgi:hypothetical protein
MDEVIDMTHGTRTLRLALAALSAAVSIAAFAGKPSADDVFSAADGWSKIADGVYERHSADGSVSRAAFGAGGAAYERARLEGELAELSSQFPADADAERALEGRIADVRAAIAAIPEKAGDGIVPTSTTTGTVCGTWVYHWDSHFTVGDDGATAISRILLTANPFGPSVPAPAAVSQTATATATQAGGSPTPVSKTGSTYKSTTSAIDEWDATNQLGPINSASCTGSTSFSMTVTPGFTCGGSPFVSNSQIFPNCVSVP